MIFNVEVKNTFHILNVYLFIIVSIVVSDILRH